MDPTEEIPAVSLVYHDRNGYLVFQTLCHEPDRSVTENKRKPGPSGTTENSELAQANKNLNLFFRAIAHDINDELCAQLTISSLIAKEIKGDNQH